MLGRFITVVPLLTIVVIVAMLISQLQSVPR